MMTMGTSWCAQGVLVGVILATSPAFAQMPTLKFDPPPGFIGGQGWMDPQSFTDPMLEGGVDVYGFQPFRGSFSENFNRTLFAERMRPEFRQPRVLSRSVVQPLEIPGADEALALNFVAEQNYYTYIHTRVAILASGAVAVVDVRARTPDRVQANLPAIGSMLESLRVVASAPAGRGATGGGSVSAGNRALAGLYVGVRSMWQGNPFGGVGSGTQRLTTYWYLLSPDGRVQRGYGAPRLANGELATFDYDGARRDAPADGGVYRVEGRRVIFVMGFDTSEAEILPDANLAIAGSVFYKSR